MRMFQDENAVLTSCCLAVIHDVYKESEQILWTYLRVTLETHIDAKRLELLQPAPRTDFLVTLDEIGAVMLNIVATILYHEPRALSRVQGVSTKFFLTQELLPYITNCSLDSKWKLLNARNLLKLSILYPDIQHVTLPLMKEMFPDTHELRKYIENSDKFFKKMECSTAENYSKIYHRIPDEKRNPPSEILESLLKRHQQEAVLQHTSTCPSCVFFAFARQEVVSYESLIKPQSQIFKVVPNKFTPAVVVSSINHKLITMFCTTGAPGMDLTNIINNLEALAKLPESMTIRSQILATTYARLSNLLANNEDMSTSAIEMLLTACEKFAVSKEELFDSVPRLAEKYQAQNEQAILATWQHFTLS